MTELTNKDLLLIEGAHTLAQTAHAGQIDSDGWPHFHHVLRIAQAAPDWLRAAAFLHDVVEDTGVGVEEIYESFGFEIGRTVELLTKLPDDTYDQYIDKLVNSNEGVVTRGALRLKLLDIEDNLARSIMAFQIGRVKKYTKAWLKVANALDKIQKAEG